MPARTIEASATDLILQAEQEKYAKQLEADKKRQKEKEEKAMADGNLTGAMF